TRRPRRSAREARSPKAARAPLRSGPPDRRTRGSSLERHRDPRVHYAARDALFRPILFRGSGIAWAGCRRSSCLRPTSGRGDAGGGRRSPRHRQGPTVKGRMSMRPTKFVMLLASVLVLAVTATPAGASSTSLRSRILRNKASNDEGYDEPLCQSRTSLCIDAYDDPAGDYVGPDEPSLEFKSGVAGSGNDITYRLTLPKEPPTRPRQSGKGATWNFQL